MFGSASKSLGSLAPAFLTMATTSLIGETLSQVLMVDQGGVREDYAWVCIVLSLNRSIRLETKVHFSPTEEYGLTSSSMSVCWGVVGIVHGLTMLGLSVLKLLLPMILVLLVLQVHW